MWIRPLTVAGMLALAGADIAAAQAPAGLLTRWVGAHEGRPLTFDFYADTMLVVNDSLPLHFEVRGDSLLTWGDSSFTVTFRFAMDRLLVETAEGAVVTMAHQDVLARPLEGRWRGSPLAVRDLIELLLVRGGTAQWRRLPEGRWIPGEWDRASRMITFTWDPDSTQWVGQYDPAGGALLFDSTFAGSGTAVLRRVYRR